MDAIRLGSSVVSNALSAASRYLPEPAVRGIEAATSLVGGGSSDPVSLSPSYQELINRQIETQLEMQQVTFISNIERSEHESRMAAVRNIRVA